MPIRLNTYGQRTDNIALCMHSMLTRGGNYKEAVFAIRSFHSVHNVVNRGVLQAIWEELAGKVGHRDQLIIC